VAVIGDEGVEIRIYKAEELVMTLTTGPEGRADTMLEADTYRVEYWFNGVKKGEHEVTLEVDSFVVWSFPAILMAVEVEEVVLVEAARKLGDVVVEEALATLIEAVGPVTLEASLSVTVEAVGPVSLEASLTQTVTVA